MLIQGAKVDLFGVGEKMITAKSDPVFGGVYKLAAIEAEGTLLPRIKISENIEKITNPGFKKTIRFYDKTTHKALADVIMLMEETVDENRPYEIFDPEFVWKRKVIEHFYTRELAEPIFEKGVCVYEEKSTAEIRAYCGEQLKTLWPEVLRFENPHVYYVDLSENLWRMKQGLIDAHNEK